MIDRLIHFLNTKRQRYAWIIGGVLWLTWLINILGGKGILDLTGNNKGTDFMAYFTAGKIILSGFSHQLYNLELVNSIQQGLYVASAPGFYPYLYPPQYAMFMVPFALLPYNIAYLVWIVLGLTSLWLSIKWLGIQKPLHMLLFSLTWFPVFATVSFGQNSFFSLAIFSLTYYLWTKEKDFLAGAAFGLLFFKPQFLLFMGFLWLLDFRKSWKALVGLGLCLIVQIGFNVIVFPQASISYLEYARTTIANFMFIKEFPIWNSFSVQAFWLAIFPGSHVLSQILFLICAVIGSIFFLLFYKKYRHDRTILFAASIIWLIWCVPYIFVYDWTLLLIPAILIWTQLEEIRPAWRVIIALLWVAGLLSSILTYLQLQVFPIAIQIAIPMLLIGIVLTYRLLLQIRKQTSNSHDPDSILENASLKIKETRN